MLAHSYHTSEVFHRQENINHLLITIVLHMVIKVLYTSFRDTFPVFICRLVSRPHSFFVPFVDNHVLGALKSD